MLMGNHFTQLKQRLGEVSDLDHATAVLSWDQETYMPEGSVAPRSEQLATLSKLSHEMFTAPATLRQLKAAAEETDTQKNAKNLAIVTVSREDYARARKLPADFELEYLEVDEDVAIFAIDPACAASACVQSIE